jgi:glutathione S-transferase
MFARIESELSAGRFFADQRFGLVDAVFAPVFRYFDAFERFGVSGILDAKPKVAAWRKALAARPSVQGAVVEDFQERLIRFLEAKDGVLTRGRVIA